MWCDGWSSSSTFDDPDAIMVGEQKPNIVATATTTTTTTPDTTKTTTENEREAANNIDYLTELMFTLWKNKEKEQRLSSSGYSPTSSSSSSSSSNNFSHSLFGSSVSGTAFARTVDETWSRELYEMNHDDRIRVNNELHGVAYSKKKEDDETTTTPEFIRLALIAMDLKIELEIENNESIPINKRRGHLRAIELHYNRRYNHNHKNDGDDDHCCYVRSKYFRVSA
jgi:hypothetical protein